ncbi:cation-translocating P-type ATPase [Loigolactobacillus backii]|uniref:cation-translocating P-type ATPase n=1 Tax=Loigolactobacillus backii TaxID=375175 RepID=UPI0007F07C16|nr:cation-transporting P-type ATPase [Loigolactobacillus backii]ANK60815.1 magnesium-transporting ATPase [Loigolactobacillus backii]ANK65769.1 magnesium-transporting ATPase [Loigolactobacillus backii]ANK68245.1 magnesium-transporting ATPase [Loigolactobacillus backii]MDA5388351.1 cation-transporting P-type ATPase [Loigolactobacillus backii]MDA5390845.1 cation-transporting P-type ATPase [Loigolactobacillus backii]
MYYDQDKKTIISTLESNRSKGLTSEEAAKRLEEYGVNEVQQKKERPAWRIFLQTFKDPLVIVLMGAVVLSLFSASYDFFITDNMAHSRTSLYEAIAIGILILGNAALAFWQENSAKKSLAALQQLAEHQTMTLRDNDWQKVPGKKLVPGDILSVKMGDFIDADVRWLKVAELQVSETHLTGEADAISKQTDELAADSALAERSNMGYAGSTVVNGNGIGIVVATGQNTELGKIAEMLTQVTDQKTPLQQTINRLTKRLLVISACLATFTLVFMLAKEFVLTGQLTIETVASVISTTIILAVASIPDALPVVLSIVLTIGARLLAKNNGLIKSLSSVETLGATTFIASDKTGTLTRNQMAVVRFYANGQNFTVEGNGYEPVGEITTADEEADEVSYHDFMLAAVLNNEASIEENEDGRMTPLGNPTDVALVVLGEKAGFKRSQLLENKKGHHIDLLRVLPFDSTRKMMSVVVKQDGQYKVLTKGAPDVILQRTETIQEDNQRVALKDAKATVEQQILDFANDALRTLAIAERDISLDEAENATMDELEQKLNLIGIAGIIDPPREEVRQSIKELHAASVSVVMITGDHAATARAIALRLGIITDQAAQVIEGKDMEQMSDDDLYKIVPDCRVYARVTPEHKQRIIRQLQRHGEVVGMTGDGVNDAPALRAANIGIAMGINGTEVTKDSADLVLLDDKFTTIERSVEAGRTIFSNIRNFIRQELITNVAEVLALLLGILLIHRSIGNVSATTPTLTTLMVMWVNMISDSLPALALGYDEPEADLMEAKPRDTKKSILADGMLRRIIVRGSVMGFTVFIAFIWAASSGMAAEEAQTVAFLTLVFGQLWHVFDARSSTTLFRRNPFTNWRLLTAVSFAALSSLLATLLPFFNELMGTVPLTAPLYLAVILLPSLPTFIISGIKEVWLRLRK